MRGQFEGSCLWGAVRFVATGQPESVAWCHCESCRKHGGAPVSVFVAFKRDAYIVTEGQITKFNSSPGRWRGFCARCGSTLTCEGERSNETHFHIGAFRDAALASTDATHLPGGARISSICEHCLQNKVHILLRRDATSRTVLLEWITEC
jgi:hypothetical protein